MHSPFAYQCPHHYTYSFLLVTSLTAITQSFRSQPINHTVRNPLIIPFATHYSFHSTLHSTFHSIIPFNYSTHTSIPCTHRLSSRTFSLEEEAQVRTQSAFAIVHSLCIIPIIIPQSTFLFSHSTHTSIPCTHRLSSLTCSLEEEAQVRTQSAFAIVHSLYIIPIVHSAIHIIFIHHSSIQFIIISVLRV
jgi:hypothetical protein